MPCRKQANHTSHRQACSCSLCCSTSSASLHHSPNAFGFLAPRGYATRENPPPKPTNKKTQYRIGTAQGVGLGLEFCKDKREKIKKCLAKFCGLPAKNHSPNDFFNAFPFESHPFCLCKQSKKTLRRVSFSLVGAGGGIRTHVAFGQTVFKTASL